MDRRSRALRWPVIVCWMALLLVAFGCKSTLQSLTLLYEGYDLPAEWNGLEGKKVAVVCKPLTSLEYTSPGVDKNLAEAISELLKTHVKGIHIISPQKVADLLDIKGKGEYIEIGKALGPKRSSASTSSRSAFGKVQRCTAAGRQCISKSSTWPAKRPPNGTSTHRNTCTPQVAALRQEGTSRK